MAELKQSDIGAIVKRSLDSLSDSKVIVQEGSDLSTVLRVKPYSELIGTYHFTSTNLLIRVLKKPLTLLVIIFRKVFQSFLDQMTQIDRYLIEELASISKQLDVVKGRTVESLEEHINDSINHKLDEKIQETHILIDRFKREINFELVELQKGGVGAVGQKDRKPVAKIINPAKVKKLNKVNVGAGVDIRADYINIDHRELEGIDVVADVLDMPFQRETLQEIFASHVVEHFIQRDFEKILKYWFSLVREGGVLHFILPNIEDMAKKYAEGDLTWEEFRSVALGGQDYASDYHFNHFSLRSMQELVHEVLPDAKFKVIEASRRNGECYEMEVLVIK